LVTKAIPTSLAIESDSILEFDKNLNLVSKNNISLIVATCKQLLEWLLSAHSPQRQSMLNHYSIV
jgi:hypothetical protein